MKTLILLLLVPLAFADESAAIHVRVPSIEQYASKEALKAAGIAKLKPEQYDALNEIVSEICLDVANDVSEQVLDHVMKQLQDSAADDSATPATPIRYERRR